MHKNIKLRLKQKSDMILFKLIFSLFRVLKPFFDAKMDG